MKCSLTEDEEWCGADISCKECVDQFERGLARMEAEMEEGFRQALTITEENSY